MTKQPERGAGEVEWERKEKYKIIQPPNPSATLVPFEKKGTFEKYMVLSNGRRFEQFEFLLNIIKCKKLET